MIEIELELPEPPKHTKVRLSLSAHTADLLDRYTEGGKHLNAKVTKDLIVDTILSRHFAKDKKFQQSLRMKTGLKEAS